MILYLWNVVSAVTIITHTSLLTATVAVFLGKRPPVLSFKLFHDKHLCQCCHLATAMPLQAKLLQLCTSSGVWRRQTLSDQSVWGAVYKLQFHNGTQGPLDNFMIQFNKNSFGLAPGSQNVPVPQLAPGSTQTAVLQLVQNPALLSPTAASAVLQVLSFVFQTWIVVPPFELPIHLWKLTCMH